MSRIRLSFLPLLIGTMILGMTLCLSIGCSTITSLSQAQKIDAACSTVGVALNVLTIANNAHKLTPNEEADVLTATTMVVPICEAPTRPTLTQVEYDAFSTAAYSLQSLAVAHQSTPPAK